MKTRKQSDASLLTTFLRSREQEQLLIALRLMVQEGIGIAALAKKGKLNRSQLYRTLSKDGNPSFRTMTTVLDALGYRLKIEPK